MSERRVKTEKQMAMAATEFAKLFKLYQELTK